MSYFCNQVFGIWGNFDSVTVFLGPSYRRILNQVVHLMVIWIVKRSNPNDHFVDQNTERPPIYCEVVPGPNNNFWRQILRSSTKRIGFLTKVLHDFSHSKIGQLDVAIDVYQYVFRF